MLLTSAPALAVNFFVDDDVNPCAPKDGSALCPFLTIQEGIDAAVSGDVVQVAPGAYITTSIKFVNAFGNRTAVVFMKDGVDVLGAGRGVQGAPDALTDSIIDGQGTAACVVFDGVSSGTLDGFLIRNGNLSGGGGGGAGILSSNSSPTISTNEISGNQVSLSPGSGILVRGTGTATINNNRILYNSLYLGESAGGPEGGDLRGRRRDRRVSRRRADPEQHVLRKLLLCRRCGRGHLRVCHHQQQHHDR